jgi:hypothetical protein
MSDEENTPLLADGFGSAMVGIGTKFNTEVAVYDYDECIRVLAERDGMPYDEAVEHMEVNVCGAYVGEHTPIFIRFRRLEQWYEANDLESEPHP